MAFPTITEKHGWTRCGLPDRGSDFWTPVIPVEFLPVEDSGLNPGWWDGVGSVHGTVFDNGTDKLL